MKSIERQRVLDALSSETGLRAVLDDLPVGIVIVDLQGEPVEWNRRAVELRGLEPGAMEAVHPEDRDQVNQSWRLAADRKEPWSAVYRFLHSDGRIVWVSARARPLQVGSELFGYIRTLEDITTLKVTEQSLFDANERLQAHAGQLEKEVQDRTAKLQEALAELDRLSYSIVHDMRAPLRGMQGFAALLLETYSTRLDDHAKDLLGRLAAAAKKQDELIHGVIAYHSYVRDRFPLAPVNLDELVTGILETYANLQPPKVQIHVHRPLGWVLAHDTLLTQSISALLSNATKFVPPGVKPRIELWSETIGAEIKLWVQDNGIGIAPEYHEKIFNIFETLHEPSTYPGRGVGLPLAKKAVQRMNGAIGVQSQVGKGSGFWIALPSVVDAVRREQLAQPAGRGGLRRLRCSR